MELLLTPAQAADVRQYLERWLPRLIPTKFMLATAAEQKNYAWILEALRPADDSEMVTLSLPKEIVRALQERWDREDRYVIPQANLSETLARINKDPETVADYKRTHKKIMENYERERVLRTYLQDRSLEIAVWRACKEDITV